MVNRVMVCREGEGKDHSNDSSTPTDSAAVRLPRTNSEIVGLRSDSKHTNGATPSGDLRWVGISQQFTTPTVYLSLVITE